MQEDPWNAIMSGAATGGILAARAGMKAAGKSALVGGVILAAIEGLNILVVSGLAALDISYDLHQYLYVAHLNN